MAIEPKLVRQIEPGPRVTSDSSPFADEVMP
jgi:hypothetical protein